MAKVPYGDPGVASQNVDAYDGPVELFLSDTPPAAHKIMTFQAGLVLPIYSVVGLVAGEVVAANNSTVDAVGFLAHKVDDTGSVSTDRKCQVFIAGHVNINALNWDAGYADQAAKLAAFDGTAPMIVADYNPHDPA